ARGPRDGGAGEGGGDAERRVGDAVVGEGENHARRGAARQRETGRRPEHEHVVDPERVVHDRRRARRWLMPLLGGRVGPGLTAGDGGDQARGGHRREAAHRQNAAPAADHCVLPPARAALASPSTLRRGTAYRPAATRVTAAPGGPALIPPGRQPAGELLAVAMAGFPVAGTSDSVLAGLSARTSSLI